MLLHRGRSRKVLGRRRSLPLHRLLMREGFLVCRPACRHTLTDVLLLLRLERTARIGCHRWPLLLECRRLHRRVIVIDQRPWLVRRPWGSCRRCAVSRACGTRAEPRVWWLRMSHGGSHGGDGAVFRRIRHTRLLVQALLLNRVLLVPWHGPVRCLDRMRAGNSLLLLAATDHQHRTSGADGHAGDRPRDDALNRRRECRVRDDLGRTNLFRSYAGQVLTHWLS